MPRIHPRDILKAQSSASNTLLSLLPVCRDLPSARNELRWLREHAASICQRLGERGGEQDVRHAQILSKFVQRRARGEPLQYILGSEWFGELEIKCRPEVLIPRQETAASVTYLAHLLRKSTPSLRVLDLCTGTGCIPLLFHHEFYSSEEESSQNTDAPSQATLDIIGVDISPDALSLARENLIHQIASQARNQQPSQQRTRSLHRIGFVQADVFDIESSLIPALARVSPSDEGEEDSAPAFDVLISNPPYISPSAYLPHSVRLYEPRLALIPSAPCPSDTAKGDEFYLPLLQAAALVGAKFVLFEVGDLEQAKRVAGMVAEDDVAYERIEIWRDSPSDDAEVKLQISGRRVLVRGRGHGRSVFASRDKIFGASQRS